MTMNIDLQYDGRNLILPLGSSEVFDLYQPRSVIDAVSFNLFREEFETHVDLANLRKNSLLFVINDGYRSTPTVQILRWIDRIDHRIIDCADFIIATGTHSKPTQDQLEHIFEELLPRLQPRLSAHDCMDTNSLRQIGQDLFGQPVFVNSAVYDHDIVISINSVEPHYFAGYTGGRKSFIPGLADFNTIERNHNMASSLNAQPLRLTGNPVAEHLSSMMDLLPEDTCIGIQIVCDSENRIASIHCGPVRMAFDRAVRDARSMYAFQAGKQYDLLIAEILPPLDLSLYQAQKALENTQSVVCDGGRLILLTACREGIGSRHFYEMATDWDRVTNTHKSGKSAFGSHKLSRVVRHTERIEICVVSELDDNSIRQVFLEPLDKESFISYLKRKVCEKSNVAVVRDAAHTVLLI